MRSYGRRWTQACGIRGWTSRGCGSRAGGRRRDDLRRHLIRRPKELDGKDSGREDSGLAASDEPTARESAEAREDLAAARQSRSDEFRPDPAVAQRGSPIRGDSTSPVPCDHARPCSPGRDRDGQLARTTSVRDMQKFLAAGHVDAKASARRLLEAENGYAIIESVGPGRRLNHSPGAVFRERPSESGRVATAGRFTYRSGCQSDCGLRGRVLRAEIGSHFAPAVLDQLLDLHAEDDRAVGQIPERRICLGPALQAAQRR